MRKLVYAGSGQIIDAATKNLVSPRRIVFEYNMMAEAIDKADHKPFAAPSLADAGATSNERK